MRWSAEVKTGTSWLAGADMLSKMVHRSSTRTVVHQKMNPHFQASAVRREAYIQCAIGKQLQLDDCRMVLVWFSIGLLSGRLAALEILDKDIPDVPTDTAIGSLVNHITGGANAKTFQPMNVNFGLFPTIDGVKGGRKGRVERYRAYTQRAKSSWSNWLLYFDGRS